MTDYKEQVYHIPEDKVGVICISNNREGISIIISADSQYNKSLCLGDTIHFKLLSINNFSILYESPQTLSFQPSELKPGFEIKMKDNIINMPFIEDGGGTNIVITFNKSRSWINIGGITHDEMLLDYHESTLKPDDEIQITLSLLKDISTPTIRKYFSQK